MASPSPPLCTQAPMLANNIQCLSTEPFVVQKEGPAHSYRQERTMCVWGGGCLERTGIWGKPG